MVKIAMDMLREGLIDEKTAVLRCEPAKLDELLHPVFDKTAIKHAEVIVKGLPASPGAATGPVVFFADDAEKVLAKTGQKGGAGAYRDFARRFEGDARRCGHPHRTRRYDVARGGRCARYGQVLRVGCQRVEDRLQGTHDRGQRLYDQRRATGFRSTVRPARSTSARSPRATPT